MAKAVRTTPAITAAPATLSAQSPAPEPALTTHTPAAESAAPAASRRKRAAAPEATAVPAAAQKAQAAVVVEAPAVPSAKIYSPPPPTPVAAVAGQRPRSGGKGRWALVAGLGLAAIAGYQVLSGPPKSDACEQALTASAQKLASGDAAGARSQSVLALASCQGDARARTLEIQASADKMLAAQSDCDRAIRSATSQLGEHRLRSARTTLDQLGTECPQAEAAEELRQRIEQAQQAASVAEDELRKLLTLGDAAGAKGALERLQGLNREHENLQALRTEVQAALQADNPVAAPVEPAATAVLAPQAPVAPIAPAVLVPQAPALPLPPADRSAVTSPATAGRQPDLVQAFLRDAEAALAQSRFDAARTFVESARRVDPANPRAAGLLRQIKERELQALKDETVLR